VLVDIAADLFSTKSINQLKFVICCTTINLQQI